MLIEYFDNVWFYREMLAVPLAVGVLWVVWMKLVGMAFQEEKRTGAQGISIEEAYADARLNEVASSEDDDDDDDGEEGGGGGDRRSKNELNSSPGPVTRSQKRLGEEDGEGDKKDR